MKESKIHRGEVILFSQGEYSDYGYCGQVIFTKNCDLCDASKEYAETLEGWERDNGIMDCGGFVSWMVANEYCLPLECRDVHLGSYGRIDFYKQDEE